MAQKFFDQPPDPDKAKALYNLTIKHIRQRLSSVPKWKQEAIKEAKRLNPELANESWKRIEQYLKSIKHPSYRKIRDLQGELKTLNRSLGEFLTTDADLFLEKGLFDALLKDDLNSKELTKTLKSFDNKMSGEKLGKAWHHTHLSSLRKILEKNSAEWGAEYNKIAKSFGYDIGDRGLIGIDPLAHKPFSPVTGDSTKWSVTGVLSDLFKGPRTKSGNLIVAKNKPSKLRSLIRLIDEHSAHGDWARGTRGFEVASELADLSPEKAFEASRSILDIEKVISKQGLDIDKVLVNMSKKWDQYENKNDWIDEVTRLVKRRGIPNIKGLVTDATDTLKAIKNSKVVGVLSEGANAALKFADKATAFVPKPIKKRVLPAISLVTDSAQVVAAQQEDVNPYIKGAQQLDRIGGATGIAALAPGPQQGLLSGTSILTYMAASRARHLGENYKSDVDKFTEDLFPSTTPGFSGVGQTELKQGKKSVLEDIKTKYNNWIYGIN